MIIKRHDHLMVGDGQRPFQLQSVTQVTDKFLRTLSLIGSAEDRGVLVANLSVSRVVMFEGTLVTSMSLSYLATL